MKTNNVGLEQYLMLKYTNNHAWMCPNTQTCTQHDGCKQLLIMKSHSTAIFFYIYIYGLQNMWLAFVNGSSSFEFFSLISFIHCIFSAFFPHCILPTKQHQFDFKDGLDFDIVNEIYIFSPRGRIKDR